MYQSSKVNKQYRNILTYSWWQCSHDSGIYKTGKSIKSFLFWFFGMTLERRSYMRQEYWRIIEEWSHPNRPHRPHWQTQSTTLQERIWQRLALIDGCDCNEVDGQFLYFYVCMCKVMLIIVFSIQMNSRSPRQIVTSNLLHQSRHPYLWFVYWFGSNECSKN